MSRRTFLRVGAIGAAGSLLAACAPAAQPSPTAAPAKPTEAPTAAAKPAAAPKPAASPAAAPAVPTVAPATTSSALAKPTTLTSVSQVLNWFAQSAHGGLFAALKNGEYEKQNLKMTIEQGGPQVASVPLVASGRHLFGLTQADTLLKAREEGIPVVAVIALFQTLPQGMMFHASNPLKDFGDLNGRKVFVSPTVTYWLYFVKKYKLDRVEQLAYTGQLASFLNDKTSVTQCFVSQEPAAAKKQGFEVGYLLNADSGFNPYGHVAVATEQTIKDKPELVQAFVTATLAGLKGYYERPESILAVLKEYNKDYDLEIGAIAAGIEKPLAIGKSNDPKQLGTMTGARFKELHDQMREVDVLKKDIDHQAAFTARFIDAAQKA